MEAHVAVDFGQGAKCRLDGSVHFGLRRAGNCYLDECSEPAAAHGEGYLRRFAMAMILFTPSAT
jgi:hypothetical protein